MFLLLYFILRSAAAYRSQLLSWQCTVWLSQ